MLQRCQLTFGLVFCCLLLQPFTGFAVEEFRISKYGSGEQIWFEAEAVDERDSADVYKLGKGEGALDPTEGAFGDIITNAGGKGWILYRFDISAADGKAGDWRFIVRVINPSNHSDWLWVLGDDGDEIPTDAPAFVRPDHIIMEENAPEWTWLRTGDFGKDGGTVNKLQDGENVMMIWTRQSSNQVQLDVFCWSSDLDYEPTDEDYENAASGVTDVNPEGLLTTTWARLKQ